MLCEQNLPTEQQAAAVAATQPDRRFVPPVDIVELPDELVLTADVPGAAADQIDVRFEDGELRIHAPVKDRSPAGARHLLQEYAVGPYVRTFRIGQSIDAARISADFVDGVLTLHLPKVEAVKPRRISIRTA